MTQLAVSSRVIYSGGRERRSDGMLKHTGQLDAGGVRATSPNAQHFLTGRGLELLYDANSPWGNLKSYDHDTSLYTDLYIDGKNIQLRANNGGTVGLPLDTATAYLGSWHAPSGWAVPQGNVWHESDVRCNYTSRGGTLLRFDFNCTVQSPGGAGSAVYIGVGLDGGVTWPSLQVVSSPSAGFACPMSGTVLQLSNPGGSHRVSLFMYASLAGACFTAGAYASIFVTEHRA